MKLATSAQISRLESLLRQTEQGNHINQKKGLLLQASQVLSEIDASTQFYIKMSFQLIVAQNQEKINELTEVLRGAIDHYKNQPDLLGSQLSSQIKMEKSTSISVHPTQKPATNLPHHKAEPGTTRKLQKTAIIVTIILFILGSIFNYLLKNNMI